MLGEKLKELTLARDKERWRFLTASIDTCYYSLLNLGVGESTAEKERIKQEFKTKISGEASKMLIEGSFGNLELFFEKQHEISYPLAEFAKKIRDKDKELDEAIAKTFDDIDALAANVGKTKKEMNAGQKCELITYIGAAIIGLAMVFSAIIKIDLKYIAPENVMLAGGALLAVFPTLSILSSGNPNAEAAGKLREEGVEKIQKSIKEIFTGNINELQASLIELVKEVREKEKNAKTTSTSEFAKKMDEEKAKGDTSQAREK